MKKTYLFIVVFMLVCFQGINAQSKRVIEKKNSNSLIINENSRENSQDFNFSESQSTFDFKGFFVKLLSYWKWFLLSLIITFLIAYNVNIRKEKIFGLEASIVVRDETTPFFATNTNLVFNWGGVSEKVQTIITTLKSRTHNEFVVDKLQYYIQYLQKGEYYYKDVYGNTPFYVQIDKNKGQLLDVLIKIKFLSENKYEVSIDFSDIKSPKVIHYVDNTKSDFASKQDIFRDFMIIYLELKLILKLNG